MQLSYYQKIVEVRNVEMFVNISDSGFGFNTSGENLNFGKLTRGDTAKKTILISQNEYDSLRVIVRNYGDISRFIQVSNSSFILKRGETKEIHYVLNVPVNQDKGTYQGFTKVILTK